MTFSKSIRISGRFDANKDTPCFRIEEPARFLKVPPNTLQNGVARGKSRLVAIQPTDTDNTNAEA